MGGQQLGHLICNEALIMVVSLSSSFARVVKLVYTYALGAYAFGRGGSSPLSRTKSRTSPVGGIFICL